MQGPRPGRAAISLKLLTKVLWRPACPLQPLRQPGRWPDCPRVATPPVDPLPHRPREATPPAGPALARVRRHNARLHHVRQHKCTHSCPICRATWARLLCTQRPLERWVRAVCAGANASVSASAAPRSVRRRPDCMVARDTSVCCSWRICLGTGCCRCVGQICEIRLATRMTQRSVPVGVALPPSFIPYEASHMPVGAAPEVRPCTTFSCSGSG
jgi:hypothetical protein